MAFNLRDRSFLTLTDSNVHEIEYLLNLSENLKKTRYAGAERQHLRDRNIALILEKASTRACCTSEADAEGQDTHVTYLGSSDSHIGYRESAKDTACALSGVFGGIEYRDFS